jgi:hypothetical protein
MSNFPKWLFLLGSLLGEKPLHASQLFTPYH